MQNERVSAKVYYTGTTIYKLKKNFYRLLVQFVPPFLEFPFSNFSRVYYKSARITGYTGTPILSPLIKSRIVVKTYCYYKCLFNIFGVVSAMLDLGEGARS